MYPACSLQQHCCNVIVTSFCDMSVFFLFTDYIFLIRLDLNSLWSYVELNSIIVNLSYNSSIHYRCIQYNIIILYMNYIQL